MDGVEVSEAAYAYFEMQATIEEATRANPELMAAYQPLPEKLLQAKEQELMDAYRANPDQPPLSAVFGMGENGKVVKLDRLTGPYIETAVKMDLLNESSSLLREATSEPSEPSSIASEVTKLAQEIDRIATGSAIAMGAVAGAVGLGGLGAMILKSRKRSSNNAQPTMAEAERNTT